MTNEPVLNSPLAYRAVFLYFEPVGALVGALPGHQNALDNQIIYDQLAAAYILFAFSGAIILRITNNLRVWRGILIGILRPEDWVNLVSLWGQAALRLAFVTGVGLKQSAATKNE
ncbi:hypothetical protein BGZ61DRAFT_497074 [Ilyonectria robusta]|uniref:uncharacterized protein n=1 Tax=Ilyonectria robusta TaxID=1079257 RepID=UPI001E8CA184|nr:uncharacterized protein BGZ61DRAFT_497074 [Ilyonectria robusta]KAH8675152.1 hypothetical protein BGZ61DRAFT_497074 [Ilyonectria robusta]